MKILQVVDFFKPSWEAGGTVKVCYEISKRLLDEGHEVTVYTTDGFKSRLKVKKNQPVDIDGMEVYYFRNLSLSLAKRNLCLPYLLPYIAKKNIQKFDIIHIHTFRSLLAIPIRNYAKKYGIPYIIQAHGSTPRMIGKKRLKLLFDVAFGYKLLKEANSVIAVSKEEAEYDQQMGANNERISIIYNGLDIESFDSLPKYGNFKGKYEINGRMILYLGRIHKSKGIDFVINAFYRLAQEMNDVILVIAGSDDGYKKELEKLIEKSNLSDKIKFTGFVDEADKISAYVDADLFVHTVQYMGGVGLTPLEAILCDTPVIVTEECGEVIKEARCGYLVEYGDLNDLKEKMKMVIENPEEGKEQVKRGKKYIMENLTWAAVVKRVEEVYLGLIQRGNL